MLVHGCHRCLLSSVLIPRKHAPSLFVASQKFSSMKSSRSFIIACLVGIFLFLGSSNETSEFTPLLGVLLLFNHRPSPRENHSMTQPKRRWRTKTKREGDAVVE